VLLLPFLLLLTPAMFARALGPASRPACLGGPPSMQQWALLRMDLLAAQIKR